MVFLRVISPPSTISFQTRGIVQKLKPPPNADFYDLTIGKLALLPIKLLTVKDLHEYGAGAGRMRLQNSAKFLQEDLPVRLAKRLYDFHQLPYIVVCNPHFSQVLSMYTDAYKKIKSFSTIKNLDDADAFTEELKAHIDDHTIVPELLAKGCKECQGLVDLQLLNKFMARTITSRIGIRLLVEQQVSLREYESSSGVGILKTNISTSDLLQHAANAAAHACAVRYGRAPEIKVDGHEEPLAYIFPHASYILIELLKNSFRATCEQHFDESELPPVHITVCKSYPFFNFRISDRGGGIDDATVENMWSYTFTTMEKKEDSMSPGGIFGAMCETEGQNVAAGHGIGLPMSRDYAKYFGGDLSLKTMRGWGTDAYLRLKILDNACDSRIY